MGEPVPPHDGKYIPAPVSLQPSGLKSYQRLVKREFGAISGQIAALLTTERRSCVTELGTGTATSQTSGHREEVGTHGGRRRPGGEVPV